MADYLIIMIIYCDYFTSYNQYLVIFIINNILESQLCNNEYNQYFPECGLVYKVLCHHPVFLKCLYLVYLVMHTIIYNLYLVYLVMHTII